jgi:hypothetical protein
MAIPSFRQTLHSVITLSVLLLTAGCANFTATAPSVAPTGASGAMAGNVHGGQQPVAFATVQIWSVGTSGYGSSGTLFATTTTSDDGAGSFQFIKQPNTDTPYPNTSSTWACPASGNPYMYLLARGGNTQGTHSASAINNAAVFFLALGQCGNLSTTSFFNLNEVTTVGSLAPLTQFFSPVTESIGSPNTTQATLGLANAFTNVANLVDVNTGAALGRISHTYHYSLAETTKINTIADVLAACMNSVSQTSTTCTSLFTYAIPPSPAVTSQPAATFTTATDTLQALWYMLANPSNGGSSNLTQLYGLIAANGAPFQPTAPYQPTDWNIGITFYSITNSGYPCGNTFSNPNKVVVDANGDPYFVNTQAYYSGYYAPTVSGGYRFFCYNFQEVRDLVFDIYGTAWSTTDNARNIISLFANVTNIYNTPVLPFSIVADGTGDIFYSDKYSGAIYEIPSANIPPAGTYSYNSASTSVLVANIGAPALSMVADASGNLWVAGSAINNPIYELVKANGYAASTVGYNPGITSSLNSMAISSTGEVLAPYYNGNGYFITHITPNPSTAGYNISYTTGSFANNSIAVDGAGNLWTANEGSDNLNGVNSGFVVETSYSGALLIPPYGITKPANSSEFSSTLVQNSVVLGTSPSIAIDLSGDIYTVNSFTNIFNTTDGPQYTVTELVGAAVPVVTPFAAGLANGTIATKP